MRERSYPWPEALLDGLGLGLFMVSACGFGVLLEHPDSPARRALTDPVARRALMGLAMGLTAVALIYSPWGVRSGAHLNPAVTIGFWRLKRLPARVAAGYIAAQFVGAAVGVAVMAVALGPLLADPAVHFVVTRPGAPGLTAAFWGEAVISFVLMGVVLLVSERPRWMRFTGLVAGFLVALWIFLEAPISGMSMNPARTFGSALLAGDWTAWWIYFIAPPGGMVAAAWLHTALGRARRGCAKLHHPLRVRCVFCGQGGLPGTFSEAPSLRDTAGHVDTVTQNLLEARIPMKNMKLVLIGIGLAGLVGGWALFRPERLWINQTVNETLEPELQAAEMASMPDAPAPIATGEFKGVAHEMKGTAAIHRLADGSRVLRLTNFHTSNGPDVQVYLVAAADARDNETVTSAGYVNVGALKGNIGDQNYELPIDLDLGKYRAVTIWCRRFGVNFGTAPLQAS